MTTTIQSSATFIQPNNNNNNNNINNVNILLESCGCYYCCSYWMFLFLFVLVFVFVLVLVQGISSGSFSSLGSVALSNCKKSAELGKLAKKTRACCRASKENEPAAQCECLESCCSLCNSQAISKPIGLPCPNRAKLVDSLTVRCRLHPWPCPCRRQLASINSWVRL